MSEFDTHEPAPGQDPVTRLKFERYVFFAFFAVMVMVVIAGIVEIKRSQQTLEESQVDLARHSDASAKAALRADRERKQAEITLDDARQKQAATEEREARRSRELGAALTQLALFESDKGPGARARARTLLDEAARIGPPPYLDLARWALLDASRPGPAPIERTPFICAAVSQDGELLAIGRGERGIDIIEIASGRKLATLANPEAAGEATVLAFSNTALFCGYRGGQLALVTLPSLLDMSASAVQVFAKMQTAIKLISTSALRSRVAAADAANNLRLCLASNPEKATAELHSERTVLAILATDSLENPLLLLDNSGATYGIESGKAKEYWRSGWAQKDQPCTQGALAMVGDELFVATFTKDALGTESDLRTVGTTTFPIEEPASLAFSIDGTLLVGDKSGRFHEIYADPADFAHGISLGSDSPLRFLARTQNSVIGISSNGTVSVRFDADAALNGRRLLRAGAIATSHGFASAQRGYVWAPASDTWLSTGSCEKLLPTPSGFAAFSNGKVRLDNGAQASAEVLICALASGGALLRGVTGEVSLLSRDGKSMALPGLARLAPDFVCPAALCDAVLTRSGNSALVIRLDSGVASREIFAPGMPMLGAIDEHGKRVALPDRDSIRILMLEGPGEALAYPRGELKALTFLFDGSILCTLEGSELAFYESASGRELLRRPTTATYMSGAMDRLFLVCPDELRELRLR